MDALHQARRGGIAARTRPAGRCSARCSRISRPSGDQPDEGIWEVRGPPRHFTYSKVMAWVAFDRAVKSAEEFGLDGPVDRWRAAAPARSTTDVCAQGFDRRAGTASCSPTARSELDASLLLMPAVGFLPPTDPRVIGTSRRSSATCCATASCCATTPAATDDGLPPGEGAFLACSFWLADAYVLLGRLDERARLFERLLALRNDVGLLAEEYDPDSRRQLGNFPQAFSHVALINTAHNLAARQSRPSSVPSDRSASRVKNGSHGQDRGSERAARGRPAARLWVLRCASARFTLRREEGGTGKEGSHELSKYDVVRCRRRRCLGGVVVGE